jgi:excisionase family DNA binding protein
MVLGGRTIERTRCPAVPALQAERSSSEFLTVEDVAGLCHAHPETVRKWLRQGRLPSVVIGRRRLVRRVDLDRLWETSR